MLPATLTHNTHTTHPSPHTPHTHMQPPSLTSRGASDNLLAQGCYKLLGSDLLTDMEFVLIPDGGVVSGEGGVVIKAHRVIVASRCEWMKRALLSGMREAIDKRIVVRDCSESTFRTFLRYLYGGWVGLETTPTEEVVDLLAAADQYETSVLRGRCEGCLVERVEDVNVFPLLQVADRYSVKRLRVSSQSDHYDVVTPSPSYRRPLCNTF